MRVTSKLTLAGLLLAAATPALAGSWSRENIAGMDYVNIYVPSSAPAVEGKRALMVNLHGCVQSADDFKTGAGWEAVAEQFGMVVAIPDVPGGGAKDTRTDVGADQCWDYYFSDHTRSNRHNDNLLALVSALLARSNLNLDPRQVFLSGLSSGGGLTAIHACLAPDVFAGVGIDAGPSVGTGPSEISYVVTDASSVVSACNILAGNNSGAFATQITSVAHGEYDGLVAPGYSDINANAMAQLYGASKDAGTSTVPGGGTVTTWSKNGLKVVQHIKVAGIAHAWPGGKDTSGGGGFIDHTSIDYAQVVSEFFFCNNRRVSQRVCDAPPPPPPPPGNSCWTVTNSAHFTAGRANQYGSGSYASYSAKGSYTWLGYGGTVTSLKETSPGYFQKVSSCN